MEKVTGHTRPAVFCTLATVIDIGSQMCKVHGLKQIVAWDLILGRFPARSHLNEPRLEPRQRFDQIALSCHHGVNVLVGHRNFIKAG